MLTFNIELTFKDKDAERMRRLKEVTGAGGWNELFASAFRYYDAVVKGTEAVKHRGGKLFLLVEFPDGSSTKEAIFPEDDERPALLS